MSKKMLLVIFLMAFLFSESRANEKIKLYAFYTPSHKVFLDSWFLPTLQDDYEIILECYDQECVSGSFMANGWIKTMIHKVDLVIRGIKECWGEVFIHSDVDIQFFEQTKDIILELIKDRDMVIQKDHPRGLPCAGFFACRGNEKTLKLWLEIKRRLLDESYMQVYRDTNDQYELQNLTIYSNPFNIVWALLPNKFFGGGTLTGKIWSSEETLPVPQGVVMHHANWTVGIENKLAQLEYVRSVQKEAVH